MNDTSRDNTSGGLVTEQVKQQAQQAAQTAVEGTQQVAGQAADRAKSMLDDRKDQGANTLQQTADALRQTGESLRQNNGGMAATIVESSATQVENVANYLRQRNVTELVDEVERYARNNAPVFMGGAFVLGLFAARFLKSSSSSSQSGGGSGGYQSYGGQYAGNPNWGRTPSGRYGGGPYDYSSGQYGGEYSYTDTRGRYEDVSGTPPVIRDDSPGLTGDAFARGSTVDRDVM